ncbi:MAG: Flp family type IVb pilin [Lentisphaerae bacterium]|jgi:Flp pilus assembly pilin Flp|nr:Flp family type IVb pilin [Lentisphaerota bacterium]
MKQIRKYWRRAVLDDSGAQFLEYALLAALVALAVGVAVGKYAQELGNLFVKMATWIKETLLPSFNKGG